MHSSTSNRPLTKLCAIIGLFVLLSGFASPAASFSLLVNAPDDEAPALTPTPLSPGPHPLGELIPWLECISKSPGTITAYFGFNNPSLDNIVVPVGENNRFVPAPPNRSQTTNFLPGRSRYFPNYAFSVTFGASSSATWQLNGYQVKADADSAECNLDWIRFQMIVDSNTAPSASQVDALVEEAATQMEIEEARIETQVNAAGLGKYQIVFNVTEGEAGSPSPVLAVSELFGDNEKFTPWIDRAIAVGLAPSLAEPMATGNEVEGTSFAEPSAPSAPSTTPSSSPNAPTAPTAPSTPSPTSTPTTNPSAPSSPNPTAAPSSQAEPSSDAPRNSDLLLFGLTIVLTLIVVLFFAC